MLNGRVQLGPLRVLRSSMDRRVKPGDDESFRCRDAPSHPSFAYAKICLSQEKPSQKASPKNSSLKKKGGGAPIGACRIRIEKGCGARPFSFPLWGTEAAGTSWSGRARLSAPHRGIRGFGLGSAQ